MKICIIPARGGSQRIPLKNIKDFHGKPIIAYSIETADKSGLFDAIVVSTDDDRIKLASLEHGAFVRTRPPEFAANEVGTQEVAREILINTKEFDYACVLYATAPLLCVEDLRRGLDLLKTNRNLNYAYSIGPDGKDAGCFYWGRREAFVNNEPLHSNSVPAENVITVPINSDRVCDINTMEDWHIAEQMYKKLRYMESLKLNVASSTSIETGQTIDEIMKSL